MIVVISYPKRRCYSKAPTKPMRQIVIYLKQTGSELVYQTSFTIESTRHEFEVVRLWEQPAERFLQYPGLIPFAVLGQSTDAEETLLQAAQQMDQITDHTTQASNGSRSRKFDISNSN
jgi:predicted transposase YdaD